MNTLEPLLRREADKVMQAWRNLGLMNDGARRHRRERRAWYWSNVLKKHQRAAHLLVKKGAML